MHIYCQSLGFDGNTSLKQDGQFRRFGHNARLCVRAGENYLRGLKRRTATATLKSVLSSIDLNVITYRRTTFAITKVQCKIYVLLVPSCSVILGLNYQKNLWQFVYDHISKFPRDAESFFFPLFISINLILISKGGIADTL